jgi:anti-sigma B factor antagonist
VTSASFEATCEVLPDGAVIKLRGDIDGGVREALAAAYNDSGDAGALELDFEHVAYINSSGIALIVELVSRARADHRPVAARSLSEHYREIFEITRLTDFITILANEPSPGPTGGQEHA